MALLYWRITYMKYVTFYILLLFHLLIYLTCGQHANSLTFGTRFNEKMWRQIYKNRICKFIRHAGCFKTEPGTNISKVDDTSISTESIKNVITPTASTVPVRRLILSEPQDIEADSSCMKFPLPSPQLLQANSITHAKIVFHVKKKRRNKKSKKRRRRKKKKTKIYRLNLYAVSKNHRKKFIRKLKIAISPRDKSKKKTLSLEIPTKSLTKYIFNNAFYLCFTCKRCKKNVRVVYPLRKRKRKKLTKAFERPQKLQEDRPILSLQLKRN